MSDGYCNWCRYRAEYIVDKNNYDEDEEERMMYYSGYPREKYEDLDDTPLTAMLCGACLDIYETKGKDLTEEQKNFLLRIDFTEKDIKIWEKGNAIISSNQASN